MTVQAGLGALWWLGLWLVPALRAPFVPPWMDASVLVILAWLDVPLFVGLGFATAVAVRVRVGLGVVLLRLAALWAALAFGWCLWVQIDRGSYLVPTLLMGASAGCTVGLAVFARADEPDLPRIGFGVMRSERRREHVLWTVAQLVPIWLVALFVIPAVLAYCERAVGTPRYPGLPWVGAGVFAVMAAMNLWSGAQMALVGRGTPLPTAAASVLVTGGPYAVVRNPMAVFALGQGLGVGLFLGSVWVLVYVVLGGVFWQLVVRPSEEADLEARFGEAYRAYRARVRCWVPWPRRSPGGPAG